MRRPTTVLLIVAVVIVAAALLLRSNSDDSTPPPPEAGATTTTVVGTPESTTTTVEIPTTTDPPVTIPDGGTACDLYDGIEVLGSVTAADLVEASGMAVSRTTADVLWAHNDSRGGPVLHAFRSNGTDLGAFEVPGAFAIDWEDMGAGPGADGTGAYLYIGDIGDNFGIRGGVVTVWQVPDTDPASLDGSFDEATALVYEMPGGPFDAEALFVDPREPALYIVTKSRSEAFVFTAPLLPSSEPITMELVATLFLDAEVSGADISPDGGLIAFRGYRSVWLFERAEGATVGQALAAEPCLAPSPEEIQGEAITLDPTWSYYTVSEGTEPPVHYVPAGS
jgi:hypothetical protein